MAGLDPAIPLGKARLLSSPPALRCVCEPALARNVTTSSALLLSGACPGREELHERRSQPEPKSRWPAEPARQPGRTARRPAAAEARPAEPAARTGRPAAEARPTEPAARTGWPARRTARPKPQPLR